MPFVSLSGFAPEIDHYNNKEVAKIAVLITYTVPKIDGNNGKSVVEVSQFGGRYGKTSDNTTSGDGDIENGDGISHRKEGGLKLEFNWEKQSNNTYKVFANLV